MFERGFLKSLKYDESYNILSIEVPESLEHKIMIVTPYFGRIKFLSSIRKSGTDVTNDSSKDEYPVGQNDDAVNEKLDNISEKGINRVQNTQKTVHLIAVGKHSANSDEVTNGRTERRSNERKDSTDLDAQYAALDQHNGIPRDLEISNVEDDDQDPIRDASGKIPEFLLRRRYSTSTKAIRSLWFVVIAFFLCITPICSIRMYKIILKDRGALPRSVNEICTVLLYCSSAVNPLIYGIWRKDFQLVYRKLLSDFCNRMRNVRGGRSSNVIKS